MRRGVATGVGIFLVGAVLFTVGTASAAQMSNGGTMLSRNFSRDEMTRSATASRLGISNEPTPLHWAALTSLVRGPVQTIRDKVGRLNTTSAYRSKALNNAIPGASSSSQHVRGEAIDVSSPTLSNREVATEIWEMVNEPEDGEAPLVVDQVILYTNTDHVHISFTTRRANRKQFLVGPTGGPYRTWRP